MNGRALLAQVYGWKEYDPAQTLFFGIAIGALVLGLLVYNLVKKLNSGEPIRAAKAAPSGFSHGSFKRRAYEAGFSEAEAAFLDTYARKLGVSSPQAIFGSRTQIDAFMRNAFKYIERHADTEESAQEQKRMLFSIREALALRVNAGSPVRTTRQLAAKTPLSIVSSRDAHYSSILALNEQRAMYVEPALDAFGQPIRFPRGSKVTVYFYTGNHVGYSFPSRAGGLVDVDGRLLMALSHSDAIKPLPSRRHQRRDARLPCRFQLVHVHAARDRGKIVKTVQVEKAAVPGIIVDLSAGGISMQTMSPVAAGDFIKVEFDLGSGTRSAYASVIRTGRLRNGGSMHAKFVKISAKTANDIMAFVYGYD